MTNSSETFALELRDIDKSFPGNKVLDGVSLGVRPGEVLALMGENGAGKSTLMRIVLGIWQPDAGEIRVRGDIVRMSGPAHARDLGVVMVHQDTRLVPDLSVARNIWLTREPGHVLSMDLAEMTREAERVLAELAVEIDVNRPVSSLSVAERQVVEIARALTSDPAVLILDEPTSALDQEEIDKLFRIVRDLRARGTAVVFISHRLPEVFAIADRITVLKDGKIIGTLPAEEASDEQLVMMMAGREMELAFPARSSGAGPVLLDVVGLSGRGFGPVSFQLRAGEILGLGGIQGNGQGAVPRALFGLLPSDGQVQLDGAPMVLKSPAKSVSQGLVYVPGDRHAEGMFASHSLRENIVLPNLGTLSRHGLIDGGAERQMTQAAMERFKVKATGPEQGISALSGGNQQKVVLGRWTAQTPKVYIFEDPTRGVDVGTKLEIYRQIRGLAAQGAGVILVASDLVELIGLSDRVAVFHRGAIIDELPAEEASEERIIGAAAGKGERHVDTTATAADAARRHHGPLRRAAARYGASLLLAGLIVGLCLVTATQSEYFLTPGNLENIARQLAPLMLVALGQLTVVLLGGIDLSVGPSISLITGVLSYVAFRDTGVDLAIGIPLALVIGAGIGGLNAVLTVALRIPDLVATLSSYSVIMGLALIVRPSPGGMISFAFTDAFYLSAWGVPLTFLFGVILYLGAEWLLVRGRVGQRLIATGSSREASFAVGLNTDRVRALAYVFCGICAALAGLMVAARIGSGDPQAGTAFTLSSVTAVVVGGASVFGGRGTAVGALMGAVVVGIMQNALNLMQVSAYYQYIWTGALTLIAVVAYEQIFARKP